MIAFVVGFAPPSLAPRLYDGAFVAAVALTCLLTFTSPAFKGWGRAFATLAVVGAPVSSEVFLGMCYTQWILAPVVALALYEIPESRTRACALACVFFLVGASSPFTLVAAPLVLWKAWSERSGFSYALLAIDVLLATFQIQGMINRFGAEVSNVTGYSKLLVSMTVLYRWLLGHNSDVVASTVVATLTLVAIAAYLWIYREHAKRPALYFLGYGLALLYVGASILNPAIDPNQWGSGARYFYLPVLMIIWTYVATEQCYERSTRSFRWSAGLLLLIFGIHVESAARRFGEDNWIATTDCLEASETACALQINPSDLGQVQIPSDFQLEHETPVELRRYRWESRA
ncbi:hypothetical protein NLM33_06385 [Bradyrhizobium sp. CCGUVB1N3]|uniref:hypothetical protein n=1 Tax=Bradyrhizobium sp. CCGUVB1N3 TaxID=2949629 RepID=UPI0020B1C99B|nr:hypothetical protein [Bradyrhizobium sp. CCGUVB1N3]MCP3469956.1 hypothetical protein [Bradyrhizobium sp. CCGUVB1N3]